MSDELTKEPVVVTKATGELAAEELDNVNGGGFLQNTLGQAIKNTQGGDPPVKYLEVKITQALIS